MKENKSLLTRPRISAVWHSELLREAGLLRSQKSNHFLLFLCLFSSSSSWHSNPRWTLASSFRSFSTEYFYGVGFQTHAQPLTWRTRLPLLVGVVTFDLSGMRRLTSSCAAASITLRIMTMQDPPLRQSRNTCGVFKPRKRLANISCQCQCCLIIILSDKYPCQYLLACLSL